MQNSTRLAYEKEFHNDDVERIDARKLPSYFVNDITYLPHEESLKLLGDLNGQKVLNYGVGEGASTDWILQRGAQEVIGIDISEKMIERARSNIISDKVKFFVMNADR